MATPDNLKTQVELHLSCSKLRIDLLVKNQPFVVVYLKDGENDNRPKEIYRTKVIGNTDNPVWAEQIIVDYKFEIVQNLRFDVYSKIAKSKDLAKQEFLGTFETTLARIMGTRGGTVTEELVNAKRKAKRNGMIKVRGNEIAQVHDTITFQFSAQKLDRKNFFGLGKSDPFYEISRIQRDGTYLTVFRSKPIMKNLNPKWAAETMKVHRLCDGDTSKSIKIEIFDWEGSGSHQFIGGFTTTVDDLVGTKNFDLINEKKRKRKKYKRSGIFEIVKAEITERHSFLEYIQGGVEINLVVAIDFTVSNGEITKPNSLHHINAVSGGRDNIQVMNEYQKAILSVGQVLEDYDTDKMIPNLFRADHIKGQ